jgi:predicted membrane-bound mannosyltransferase
MNQVGSHEFSMYFHTTLRNIGLYTSLAYGSLAYSRIYRNDTPLYDVMLILISLAFLAISFIMNYYLYLDTNAFILKNKKGHDFIQLLRITQAIFGIHIILVLLGTIILVRSLSY